MRLNPTDFHVLDALSDGNRNTAANLAHELDRDRTYVETRLPILADYRLVDRVGPAPDSGLYEITDRGHAAIEHRNDYRDADDFDALVEDSRTATAD